MCNRHRRIHALKFQSVALTNGLIASLNGPYESRKHDPGLLRELGLLVILQRSAWSNKYPPCIYDDPVYLISVQ